MALLKCRTQVSKIIYKNDLAQGKYQDIEQFWLKGDLLEYGLITQDKFRFYVHWLDFKAGVLLFQ